MLSPKQFESKAESDAWWAALDRVKVGEFAKLGYREPLRGVVHIGANDGYEVKWYRQIGVEKVLCFEPLDQARNRFVAANPDTPVSSLALGNMNGTVMLKIAGDGVDGASSFLDNLKVVNPNAITHRPVVGQQEVVMRRWSDIADLHKDDFNCCVIDVQGMELDVLRGMDEEIQKFDYFVVECSAKPVYKGEAAADEVVAFMAKAGFEAITPIALHDDVLFVKQTVLKATGVTVPRSPSNQPKGNKLNCGSGQRPFPQADGWINLDCNPRWNPDVLSDWSNLSMFDDASLDVVVSHHSMEHVGCGEAEGFVREAHRILKPEGSLLVFVPDLRALAQRWLTGQLDTQLYMTNLYGPFDGTEASRHRWGYDKAHLQEFLTNCAPWSKVKMFDWRTISGGDFARDWHVLAMEAVR